MEVRKDTRSKRFEQESNGRTFGIKFVVYKYSSCQFFFIFIFQKKTTASKPQLHKKMDTVYVFTDCEPDDLAAIIILRTKFNVRLVIAGKAVDNEGFNRTQVGLDFVKTLDPPLDAEPMVYEMNTEALAKEALMVMYARPHAIVWLCSFASLFMAYQKDPKAFMGNNLWAYGSVNLRWAYKKMDDPNKIQFFEMLNTGFQSASIFDTHFAFGTLNSSHAESTPFLAKFFSP